MTDIPQTKFSNAFAAIKFIYFDSNLTEICYQENKRSMKSSKMYIFSRHNNYTVTLESETHDGFICSFAYIPYVNKDIDLISWTKAGQPY